MQGGGGQVMRLEQVRRVWLGCGFPCDEGVLRCSKVFTAAATIVRRWLSRLTRAQLVTDQLPEVRCQLCMLSRRWPCCAEAAAALQLNHSFTVLVNKPSANSSIRSEQHETLSPASMILSSILAILQAEQSHSPGAQLFGGFPSWPASSIKGLVGVSGVYNCHGLADHFDRQGLYRRLFERIMAVDGQPQLKLVSPTYCVKVRVLAAHAWGVQQCYSV